MKFSKIAIATLVALSPSLSVSQEAADKIFIMSPPPGQAKSVGVRFKVPGWENIGTQATPWETIGEPTSCGEFAPATSLVNWGESFTQSRNCAATERRFVGVTLFSQALNQTRQLDPAPEFRNIAIQQSQVATGERDYSLGMQFGEWSEFANTGGAYGCDAYTPGVEIIDFGVSFTQSRTCSQTQIRNRDAFVLYASGAVIPFGEEVDEFIVSVSEDRQSVGTRNFVSQSAVYGEWSAYVSNNDKTCGAYPSVDEIGEQVGLFEQVRACSETRTRTRDVMDIYANGDEVVTGTETDIDTVAGTETRTLDARGWVDQAVDWSLYGHDTDPADVEQVIGATYVSTYAFNRPQLRNINITDDVNGNETIAQERVVVQSFTHTVEIEDGGRSNEQVVSAGEFSPVIASQTADFQQSRTVTNGFTQLYLHRVTVDSRNRDNDATGTEFGRVSLDLTEVVSEVRDVNVITSDWVDNGERFNCGEPLGYQLANPAVVEPFTCRQGQLRTFSYASGGATIASRQETSEYGVIFGYSVWRNGAFTGTDWDVNPAHDPRDFQPGDVYTTIFPYTRAQGRDVYRVSPNSSYDLTVIEGETRVLETQYTKTVEVVKAGSEQLSIDATGEWAPLYDETDNGTITQNRTLDVTNSVTYEHTNVTSDVPTTPGHIVGDVWRTVVKEEADTVQESRTIQFSSWVAVSNVFSNWETVEEGVFPSNKIVTDGQVYGVILPYTQLRSRNVSVVGTGDVVEEQFQELPLSLSKTVEVTETARAVISTINEGEWSPLIDPNGSGSFEQTRSVEQNVRLTFEHVNIESFRPSTPANDIHEVGDVYFVNQQDQVVTSSENRTVTYGTWQDNGGLQNCNMSARTCDQPQVRSVTVNGQEIETQTRSQSFPIQYDQPAAFDAQRLANSKQIPIQTGIIYGTNTGIQSGTGIAALYYQDSQSIPVNRSPELTTTNAYVMHYNSNFQRLVGYNYLNSHDVFGPLSIDPSRLFGGLVVFDNGVAGRIWFASRGSTNPVERAFIYYDRITADFMDATANGQRVP